MARILLTSWLILGSGILYGFSTTNIQYLYGSFNGTSGLDTRNGGKSTITLEHYSTNPYGDLYGFADYGIADDRYKYADKTTDLYFEISPRISLDKMTGRDLSTGPFKEWYLSFQYNRQVHRFEDYYAYLYGAGTNLDIKGFDVFGLNLYKKNKKFSDNTYQMTINYKSADIFGTPLMFSGFTDWTEDDLMSQNQLVYKLGTHSMTGGGTAYIGTEWLYYRLEDTAVKSNLLQLLLKVAW